MDARVGHSDSARPSHLQTQALVRALRNSDLLRLLSEEMTPDEFPAEQFQQLVTEAISSLPKRFRDAMVNMAIVVEDEPTPDQLRQVEVEPPDTIYGLYEGIPLPERQWAHGNVLPDKISIFRLPILEDSVDEDDIVVGIGETLIHEVGHYFGLSEEEIMDIEEKYWRGDEQT